MQSYCVKCKRHTSTNNVQVVKTKNAKHLAKGICSVCGSKKSRFVSAKEGSGLLGKALGIGKVPILGDIPLFGALF